MKRRPRRELRTNASPGSWVLVLIALATLPAAASGCSRSAPRAQDMDILIVTIDALRADHLGAYGYQRPTSPMLDRFALDATLFERALVQWPRTTPSLTSVFTGKYPFSTGVMGPSRGHYIRDENRMLAEVLSEKGFATFAVVTNGCVSAAANFLQGFQETHETYLLPEPAGSAERVTEVATDMWRQRAGRGRVFGWVHYLEPHWAYNAPVPYKDMFVGDAYYDPERFVQGPPPAPEPAPEPAAAPEAAPRPAAAGEGADSPHSTRGPDGPKRKPRRAGGILAKLFEDGGGRFQLDEMIARYDGEIRYVDTHVGALLETFRREGWLDRTLVVVSADHGEALGEHDYYFDHGGFPHSDCARVPLVVRHPDERLRPRWVSHPTEMVNLFPTVLDLAGLPIPEDVQGKSLLPVLRGKRPYVQRHAFVMAGEARTLGRLDRAAVLDERYELVWRTEGGRRRRKGQGPENPPRVAYQLYDLLADPGETKDLLVAKRGDPQVEREADRLRRVLDDWLEEARSKPTLEPARRKPSYGPAIEENLRALGYVR